MAVMGSKTILTVIFCIAAFVVLLRTIMLLWNTYLADFSIFYQAAFIGFSLENPYIYKDYFAPYIYPPLFLLLIYPLYFFSLQTASNIWLIFSVCVFLMSLLLLKKILKASFFSLSLVFLLSVLSFPFKFTLGMGQVNSLLLFSICMFVYYYQKNVIVSSAFFFVATVIKIIPLLFIYPLLYKRSYISLLFIAMAFLVGILMSMVLFDDEINGYYLFSVLPSVIAGGIKESYYNQSLLGTLDRLGLQRLASISQILIGLVPICLLWIKKPSLISSVSLILTTVLLISSFAWQHHLLLLLIPFYYMLHTVKKTLLYILLFISYCLIALNITSPAVFETTFFGNIILSHATWGMILLLLCQCFVVWRSYEK